MSIRVYRVDVAAVYFFSVSVSPRVIGFCIQTRVNVDTITAKVAVLLSRVRAQNTKSSFFHSQNIFIFTIYVLSTVYVVLRPKQIRYKKKKKKNWQIANYIVYNVISYVIVIYSQGSGPGRSIDLKKQLFILNQFSSSTTTIYIYTYKSYCLVIA